MMAIRCLILIMLLLHLQQTNNKRLSHFPRPKLLVHKSLHELNFSINIIKSRKNWKIRDVCLPHGRGDQV